MGHAFTDMYVAGGAVNYSVDDHLGERQGLQDRKGSLPPRHPGSLTPVSPGARQPSPRASQGILLTPDCLSLWFCYPGLPSWKGSQQ